MKRSLLTTAVLAVGLSLAGAAVPANAQTSAPVGSVRDVASDAPMYGTPRLDTAQVGIVHAGEFIEAYCAFSNAGREWVKINRGGDFGYVTSDALRSGGSDLPSTCPTEIETVQVTLYGDELGGTETMTATGRLECPISYPYLVNDGKNNVFTPPSFVENASEWVGVIYGLFTHRDGFVTGATGAVVTNFGVTPETLTITASCTKNPSLAKRP